MIWDEISRLEKLVESKETLLKKAIGADSLMIGEKDGKLDFPWLKSDAGLEEIHAFVLWLMYYCSKPSPFAEIGFFIICVFVVP